jgi:large subunit ribosomal protein L24
MRDTREQGKQARRIRSGDNVMVIAGNDRGKVGKVLMRRGDRIVVQGLNMRKKNMKKTQMKPQGEIVTLEMSIHASNLKLVAENEKPITVKVRTNKQGERELFYADNGRQTLYRPVKKSI